MADVGARLPPLNFEVLPEESFDLLGGLFLFPELHGCRIIIILSELIQGV